MTIQVMLPELGEGVIEAQISRWLKHEGEPVQVDDPLVEIETDKVTTEVVSDFAGILLKIVVPEGEMANVGAPLAVIGAPGETVATNGKASTALPKKVNAEFASSPKIVEKRERPKISPIAKRLAQLASTYSLTCIILPKVTTAKPLKSLSRRYLCHCLLAVFALHFAKLSAAAA